jgi:hypothetical protein
MPIEVFKPSPPGGGRVAEKLAALAPRTLLFAYWISFFTAALLSAASPSPLWAIGILAQALLLVVWCGYPLAILYAVVPTRIGRIGALALAAGVMVAVGLVAYTETHQADSQLISLLVFVLLSLHLSAAPVGFVSQSVAPA